MTQDEYMYWAQMRFIDLVWVIGGIAMVALLIVAWLGRRL